MVTEIMDKIKNEHGPIPVSPGDTLTVVPQGWAERDAFVKIQRFMIFIKGVEKHEINQKIKIKINVVKQTYAFAERI